jgi:hypothetical protein
MNKLQALWYGKSLHERYPYKTRWYHKHIHTIITTGRKTLLVIAGLAVVSGTHTATYFVGKMITHSKVTHANIEVEKIVEVESKAIPPVMQRIAKCESPTGHFEKDGKTVVFRTNKNGSQDIGKYQINTIHLPLATKLGYNVTVEKDNEAFAMYLYKNSGTEPWYSSEHCWNK